MRVPGLFGRNAELQSLAGASALLAVLVVLLAPAAFAAGGDNASPTMDQEREIIAAICVTQMPKLGVPGCRCLAERATKELDDRLRDYLILTVTNPRAAERDPMAQAQPDLRILAEFLDKAATACASPAAVPAQ